MRINRHPRNRRNLLLTSKVMNSLSKVSHPQRDKKLEIIPRLLRRRPPLLHPIRRNNILTKRSKSMLHWPVMTRRKMVNSMLRMLENMVRTASIATSMTQSLMAAKMRSIWRHTLNGELSMVMR